MQGNIPAGRWPFTYGEKVRLYDEARLGAQAGPSGARADAVSLSIANVQGIITESFLNGFFSAHRTLSFQSYLYSLNHGKISQKTLDK
jgi:hypothetical protein